MLGHNQPSFDAIVEENLLRGLYLVQRDTLISACKDPRLGHRHRWVLAEIVAMTNDRTGTAFPGRKHLATITGYAESTIASTVYDLIEAGYLISARRAPEGGKRALAHYTVARPNLADLQAEIARYVEEQRALAKERIARRAWAKVDNGVNVRNDVEVHNGVNLRAAEVDNGVDVDTVIDVDPVLATVTSNITTTLGDNKQGSSAPEKAPKQPKASRATRLSQEWLLPKSWGEWALDNYAISATKVRDEAASFRDYWTSVGGVKGTKTDWEATWRNWIRNSRGRYRRTREDSTVAPDLLAAQSQNEARDAWAEVRRNAEAPDD